MEDGNDDETLARISGDDRQRCIHGRSSTYTDRCQFAEVFCQQRSTQQGENLAADVGKKGDGSQFGAPVFGDEDTRKRVISES